MRSSLQKKYSKVKVIVIDEISMVLHDLLFYVHLRLVEMLQKHILFAEITIIAVKDFLKFPLVKARPVYANTKMVGKILLHFGNF